MQPLSNDTSSIVIRGYNPLSIGIKWATVLTLIGLGIGGLHSDITNLHYLGTVSLLAGYMISCITKDASKTGHTLLTISLIIVGTILLVQGNVNNVDALKRLGGSFLGLGIGGAMMTYADWKKTTYD